MDDDGVGDGVGWAQNLLFIASAGMEFLAMGS